MRSRLADHRIADHRTADHRTADHRTADHRTRVSAGFKSALRPQNNFPNVTHLSLSTMKSRAIWPGLTVDSLRKSVSARKKRLSAWVSIPSEQVRRKWQRKTAIQSIP